MKFFVDECLSPELARHLNRKGYGALHPRDVGRSRSADHAIAAWCFEQDRILVTANAADFRKLLGCMVLHPGLLVLPSRRRDKSLALLDAAVAFLKRRPDPAKWAVNKLIEVDHGGAIDVFDLAARER